MNRLEVANPVAVSAIHRVDAAKRDGSLDGKRVALYWNMKAGGDVALDRVETVLRSQHPTATFSRVQGSVGSTLRKLTPRDAERLATEFDLTVGSTGD